MFDLMDFNCYYYDMEIYAKRSSQKFSVVQVGLRYVDKSDVLIVWSIHLPLCN